MREQLRIEDFPPLPGYTTVSEAATRFNTDRQKIYYWCTTGVFRDVVRTGREISSASPMLLIPTTEVERVFTEKSEEAQLSELKKNHSYQAVLRAWDKRVKRWAERQAGFTPLGARQRPTQQMRDAYVKANAHDPLPDPREVINGLLDAVNNS